MVSALTLRKQERLKRKSERYSKLGKENEKIVVGILESATNKARTPLFSKVTLNEAYSPEDLNGKDIRVEMEIDGKIVARSFGITISRRGWECDRAIYASVPQFYFPIGVNPETVIKRVLGLFE